MAFTPNVWSQIKNLSKGDLLSALEKDGWLLEEASHSAGSARLYVKLDASTNKPERRVSIHYHHAKDTFRSPKLLKDLLFSIGWTEADMKALKLIK